MHAKNISKADTFIRKTLVELLESKNLARLNFFIGLLRRVRCLIKILDRLSYF